MGQISPQSVVWPEGFCYSSANSSRNICRLPGCWSLSAPCRSLRQRAELGWEDAMLFHGCWERKVHGHELLFRSWTKLEHVAGEKREAQMPNEFSRERRQINLPSWRSLTQKLCITCLALIFLSRTHTSTFSPPRAHLRVPLYLFSVPPSLLIPSHHLYFPCASLLCYSQFSFSPRNCWTQERSMEIPMLDDLALVRILPIPIQHHGFWTGGFE